MVLDRGLRVGAGFLPGLVALVLVGCGHRVLTPSFRAASSFRAAPPRTRR